MNKATRILLIDDHLLFREAIASLLSGESDFEIAGDCASVEEGIRILQQEPVDVVLLDIDLGEQQGGAFLNRARAQGFAGKILVVTAGVSKFEAKRLMQRGCSGIVLKQEPPRMLIQKIRAAVDGTLHDDPAALHAVLQEAQSSGRTHLPLTPRERQVLRLVFGGKTNGEIAFELSVSEPLVKAVMQQLFTKTGVRTRSQLVRTAIERYWNELERETEEAS